MVKERNKNKPIYTNITLLYVYVLYVYVWGDEVVCLLGLDELGRNEMKVCFRVRDIIYGDSNILRYEIERYM